MRNVVSKGPRRAAALIVASAAVMLAAACGGSSGSSNTSGTTGTGGGNGGGGNQQLTAYVNCMKQNGVTLTLPSFGPRTGASRGAGGYGDGGARPSGQPRPRPSGSFGGGRGGFPGGPGGFFRKPAGVDDATWQKAQSACASTLPSRGTGGFGRGGGANSAYRNCLQQHGVTMAGGAAPNTADPTVKKAMETCKVLRPAASPTPTS